MKLECVRFFESVGPEEWTFLGPKVCDEKGLRLEIVTEPIPHVRIEGPKGVDCVPMSNVRHFIPAPVEAVAEVPKPATTPIQPRQRKYPPVA